MGYVVGLILSLAVAIFATLTGLARGRAFYPTVAIVVASYYVLFAAMGASNATIAIETVIAAGFSLLAVLGFKKSCWFLVIALVGHGLFDCVHSFFINNPGMPRWWPSFCATFDIVFGAWLGVTLMRGNLRQAD